MNFSIAFECSIKASQHFVFPHKLLDIRFQWKVYLHINATQCIICKNIHISIFSLKKPSLTRDILCVTFFCLMCTLDVFSARLTYSVLSLYHRAKYPRQRSFFTILLKRSVIVKICVLKKGNYFLRSTADQCSTWNIVLSLSPALNEMPTHTDLTYYLM